MKTIFKISTRFGENFLVEIVELRRYKSIDNIFRVWYNKYNKKLADCVLLNFK